MPNLNVCTGPAFGVGAKGELEPANVRNAAWPFSSVPATAAAQMQAANGLRYDQTTATPGGGLWVPGVSPNAAMSRQTGTPVSSIAVNGTPTEVGGAGLASLVFVNASPIQSLAVMCALSWSAAISFGASTWMQLWGGATLSIGAANVPWAAQDSNGGGTGSFVWTGNAADSLSFYVPPGSTVSLAPRLGVANAAGSGAMTWNSWKFTASAFYGLVDPVNLVSIQAIPNQTWTHGTAITPINPRVTDSDPTQTVFTWAILPYAPPGTTFSTSTGQLSGTPSVAWPLEAYTITATDATGSSGSVTFSGIVA